jgi:hypothetical protein
MELEQANKMMGIVNEGIQKIIEIKEKLESSRWKDPKHQLIYEGVSFCYLEILEMQDKLENFVLGKKADEKIKVN